MTNKDIDSLINTISVYYMEKGYITSRAFLRQQDAQSIFKGNLIITVIEGKIDNLNIDGGDLLALKMIFPNMKGKILNLRDIEQGLEQLNRLHSNQVKIDIQPSAKVGYSDVILKINPFKLPLSINLIYDNNGQKSKGENQVNTFLQLDNVFRLADSWTIFASKDTDFKNSHRNWYINSGVSIPYGYWLFSYQYSKNESFQSIPINYFGTIRYTSRGNSHSILANRVLYRDGKQKLGLNVSFTSRKTENILGDYKISSSSNLSTVNLGLNYSSMLFGGYFRFNPTITKGLAIFGATKDDNLEHSPKSNFYKVSVNSSYFKPITNNIYYLTSAYAQTSPNSLYSSEKLSIGGLYSVRGFKDKFITGNLGGYWRNEINWKLVNIPKFGELSFNGSLDTGWIKGELARSSDGGNLTGTSLGLNLNNKISNISFSVGKPLNYPNYLKPDNLVIYWSTSFNL